jgi:cation/acetate symporter
VAAAASFFPVILLGIFDKRANRAGAVTGMIVGLLFTVIYIAGNRSGKIFGTDEPLMNAWCFGISAEGIGAIGCLLNFFVAFSVSRFSAPPPLHITQLVESIRIRAGSLDPQTRFDESDV